MCSFLWLNNIPLYIGATTSLSLIGQRTPRLLPILAIVNSAAINTGVHVPFPIMISSEYLPSSGIWGYIVVLYLVF